jgi:hypothetical protein
VKSSLGEVLKLSGYWKREVDGRRLRRQVTVRAQNFLLEVKALSAFNPSLDNLFVIRLLLHSLHLHWKFFCLKLAVLNLQLASSELSKPYPIYSSLWRLPRRNL